MADPKRIRARRRNRVIAGTAIGVAICLVGGGVAWAALRPQGPSYRTASAITANVTQTTDLAGTVASATRVDQAFQVSGTVASVGVKVGQSVTAGQTLATLSETTLGNAVTEAQQSVTTAEQTLDDDLDSQTSTASSTTSGSSASSSASAASDVTTDSAADALAYGTFVADVSTSSVAAAQVTASTIQSDVAAVETAQNNLESDIDNASTGIDAVSTDVQNDLSGLATTLGGLTASNGDCETFASLEPTQANEAGALDELKLCQTDVSEALDSTTASATVPISATTTLSDLSSALTTLSNDQTQLKTDESALNTAVSTLQTDASKLSTSTPTSTRTPTPSKSTPPKSGGAGAGSGSGSGKSSGTGKAGSGSFSGGSGSGSAAGTGSGTRGSTGSGSKSGGTSAYSGSGTAGTGTSGSKGSTSTPASAQQIVADEASVTAAQDQLSVAQQNVGLATLTTPISGTVAAVSLTAGSSVSAKSTSDVISVIGTDGWVVNTSASATTVGPLKVGESASVNVSGVTAAQTGKVTSIGFLNTASDSTTPSYAVTVALDGSGAGLLNGASARLTVNVDKASGVLTVPSSAVHLGTGNTYTVDTLTDGREQATEVKVGAIGTARTQITGGLSAGTQVVLADLDSTVSSDSTSTTTGTSGGLGAGLGGTTGTTGRFGGGAGGFTGGGTFRGATGGSGFGG